MTPFLLALALGSAEAQPRPLADVFVDAQAAGCAAATGSSSNPVCSINAGLALAAVGDTIRIAPGTYVENLALGFDVDLVGTGGADVTIIDGGATGSVIHILQSVTVSIEGLTVTNGSATRGGGIWSEGTLALTNSTIRDNRATGGAGGGVFLTGQGPATISKCSIEENYADGWGGGVCHSSISDCIIRDTTIRDNVARENGGGFAHDSTFDGTGHLENSTISGNRTLTGSGGGVISYTQSYFPNYGPTSLYIDSCTITNNHAETGAGGGVFYAGPISLGAEPLFVRNTVVVGNGSFFFYSSGSEDVDGTLQAIIVSQGHNLSSLNALSFQNDGLVASAADVLGPLQDNGGPGWTHALLPGSVAVDSGSTSLLFDQRGISRPAGSDVDRGAYELLPEFCFGDGGSSPGCTDCPCSNDAPAGTIGGCLNSQGTSARVRIVGIGSASSDTLRVNMTGGTVGSFAILTAGANLAPSNAANPCFGQNSGLAQSLLDGLRCVVGDVRRLGTRPMDGSGSVGITNNSWGFPGSSLFQLGAFSAGETRHFQAVYRDDPLLGCMTGLNTSQSVSVTFQP